MNYHVIFWGYLTQGLEGALQALVLRMKYLHRNFIPHGQQISAFKAFKSHFRGLNSKCGDVSVSLEQVADIRFRSEVNLANSSHNSVGAVWNQL